MEYLLILVGAIIGAILTGTLICWLLSEIVEFIGGYGE